MPTATSPTLPLLRTLRVVTPETPPAAVALYDQAVAHWPLQVVDYLTVRDLLEHAPRGEPAVHALLLAQCAVLAEGSLCLPLAPAALARRLTPLAGTPADAQALAADALRLLATDQLAALVGSHLADARPLIRQTTSRGAFLYFHKYLVQEQWLHDELQRLLHAPRPAVAVPALAAALAEVCDRLPCRRPDGQPLSLGPEQRLAVALAALQPFTIVSGGPGTGKTSIVVAIVRALARLGVPAGAIGLAAPTGRAAQRLTDALQANLASLGAELPAVDEPLRQLQGTTLHHLLRYRPQVHAFTYGRHYPLPLQALIIDEVSMVDAATMASVLQAVADGTRVVFLGDKDQLPSVEAGAVLAELIPSHAETVFSPALAAVLREVLPGAELPPARAAGGLCDHVVILRNSYRSERTILHLADAVNRGQLETVAAISTLTPAPLSLWSWPAHGAHLLALPPGIPAAWQALLDTWADQHYRQAVPGAHATYPELVRALRTLPALPPVVERAHPAWARLDDLCRAVERVRVLTFTRDGTYGAGGVNQFLVQRLRPLLDPGSRGRAFAGLPILLTRNDHVHQLYNGEVGVGAATADGATVVVFRRADRFLVFAPEALAAWQEAFAMTVHKSQGSEYDQVLVALPPTLHHRLLSREILYTALTRARHLVLLAGSAAVLHQAATTHHDRQSGQDLWPSPPLPHGAADLPRLAPNGSAR